MRSKLLLKVMALVLSAALATPAAPLQAAPINARPTIHVAAMPPMGFIKFCTFNAAQCAPSKAASVRMTSDLLALLSSVNTKVNRSMRPRSDNRDVWAIGRRAGDCEDYVLTKRAQLIRKGVPAGALRIATTTYRGQGHAILVVKTSAGDFVLDNLSSSVLRLKETGYRIRTMSTANPMRWAAG